MRWEWIVFTSVLPLLSSLSLQAMADRAVVPAAAPQAPYLFQYDKREENDTESVEPPHVSKVFSEPTPDQPKHSTPVKSVEEPAPPNQVFPEDNTHDSTHDAEAQSTPGVQDPINLPAPTPTLTPTPKVEQETVPTSCKLFTVARDRALDVLR